MLLERIYDVFPKLREPIYYFVIIFAVSIFMRIIDVENKYIVGFYIISMVLISARYMYKQFVTDKTHFNEYKGRAHIGKRAVVIEKISVNNSDGLVLVDGEE